MLGRQLIPHMSSSPLVIRTAVRRQKIGANRHHDLLALKHPWPIQLVRMFDYSSEHLIIVTFKTFMFVCIPNFVSLLMNLILK